MPLSWNEIRDRSVAFSKEWKAETSEDAEAKSFWDAFFNVFGITRRRVATFETPVKKSDGKGGFIDLLWKGVLLVEHKSRGKNLDRAFDQATDYFHGLKERDLPRYVLVSDFARFRLYDLDETTQHEFELADLHKNARLFGFIAGYQARSFGQQDPVNIAAAERLGKLHDQLKEVGYTGHALEVFLVRLLFCLFAEDNSIFERQQFRELLEQRSNPDGSDLAPLLAQLFQVLQTPGEKRLRNLDEQLHDFQYINGKLFEEALPLASFDRRMRETLLDCSALDWSRISPAIFGALFQSIMDAEARRNLGAHYTTEQNILKALRPLFIDSLRAEFEQVRRDSKRLFAFHEKLGTIRILDPACGCGNFLVVAYRELRLLELDVLREIFKSNKTGMLDVSRIVFVDVDQFYGIEIEEFPAQIAQVALWMTDHQMNLKVSEEFGQYFARLPLRKAPNIVNGNALRLDWSAIVGSTTLNYIVGNPPFVGHHWQSAAQKSDQSVVMGAISAHGVLDYVCNWYVKTIPMLSANPNIGVAFVSTNSITQGEQVGILWSYLLKEGIHINFAHRTFQWNSEARGQATVQCVIIGFGLMDQSEKWLFDYETPKGQPHAIRARNINPYLVDAGNVVLQTRNDPICNVPRMAWGNKPTDGGHLILSVEERAELLKKEPKAAEFIRRFMSGGDFINDELRYCLWLVNAPPEKLRALPEVMKRAEAVRKSRLESKASSTREYAKYPTLFRQIAQPDTDYLAIPEVSSERRPFIPIAFVSSDVICSNKIQFVPLATKYHFGVLSSTMHMAWVRAVCGRLESRYSYSNTVVYNNFPWPQPTSKQRSAIETASDEVLEIRNHFKGSNLADLYDPDSMPAELTKAHQSLDRAVDGAYGKHAIKTEAERVALLFELYGKITAPLDVGAAVSRKVRKTLSSKQL